MPMVSFRAFCLASTVFAAATLPTLGRANPFRLDLDTNADLQFGVAVFTYDNNNAYDVIADLGVEPNLNVGSHTLLSNVNPFNGDVRYTYLAVYGTGISIGLDSTVAADAIANETPFEDLLGMTHNESDVVHGLMQTRSDDPIAVEEGVDTVTSFIRSIRTLLPRVSPSLVGEPGTMTKFSGATYGGTVVGQAVPEPASMTILGAGALAMLRRRRR